jgi:hypothetical protein
VRLAGETLEVILSEEGKEVFQKRAKKSSRSPRFPLPTAPEFWRPSRSPRSWVCG